MPRRFICSHHLEDHLPGLGIQAHRGLVEHDQLGVEHQAAGELDEPLLTAGEAAGLLAGALAHDRVQLLHRAQPLGDERGSLTVNAPISTFSRTVISVNRLWAWGI